MDEETSSKMLWLYLGSLGFNSHGAESDKRRTLMETGFDDAFTANNALIEYITSLEKNHGYDPMPRFRSFLEDTGRRVVDYVESISKALYLLQRFGKANPFGYKYTDIGPGISTINSLADIFQLELPRKPIFPKAFVKQVSSVSDVVKHRSTHIDTVFEYQGIDYVIQWQQLRPISFLSAEALENKGYFSSYPHGYPNKGVWKQIPDEDKDSILEIAREELEVLVLSRVAARFLEDEINELQADLRRCKFGKNTIKKLCFEDRNVEDWFDKIEKIYDRVFDLGFIILGYLGHDSYFPRKINCERFVSHIRTIISEWNDQVKPILEEKYKNLDPPEKDEIAIIIKIVDGDHNSLSKRLEILAKHMERVDYTAKYLSIGYRTVIIDENELKMERNKFTYRQNARDSEPSLLY